MSHAVPLVPEPEWTGALPAPVTRQHLSTFSVLYREHCETILEAVYNLQVGIY